MRRAIHLLQPARGLTRVAALLLSLAAIAGWLALDSLRARANELARDAGSQLLAYAATGAPAETHTLRVNGLALRIRTGTTRDPAEHVLAVLAERCRERGGELAVQLQAHARARLPPRIAARAFDPVLRLADDRGGFVGCLDLGAQRLDPGELLERVRRFGAQADVAELGALRFAFTRREHGLTRYVAVWSDGPLPLRRAFPVSGDAPGIDAPTLPRPPHSRRVLSAWQAGAAPLWLAYESPEPVERALAEYQALLRAGGYHVLSSATSLLATKADRTAAVLAAERGGTTLLSIAP